MAQHLPHPPRQKDDISPIPRVYECQRLLDLSEVKPPKYRHNILFCQRCRSVDQTRMSTRDEFERHLGSAIRADAAPDTIRKVIDANDAHLIDDKTFACRKIFPVQPQLNPGVVEGLQKCRFETKSLKDFTVHLEDTWKGPRVPTDGHGLKEKEARVVVADNMERFREFYRKNMKKRYGGMGNNRTLSSAQSQLRSEGAVVRRPGARPGTPDSAYSASSESVGNVSVDGAVVRRPEARPGTPCSAYSGSS